MPPIVDPEDLQAEAFAAAQRVRAGEMSRAQAADHVYDRAIGAGLVRTYGEDTVQAWISGPFELIDDQTDLVPCLDDDANSDELDARAIAQSSTLPRVAAINLEKFLKMDIPPRKTMLAPWLAVQGLAMIHAPRGTGKTRIGHGVAYAVATGSGFLRWAAPQPKRVLLLDGEMPATTLQDMLRATVQASQPSLPDPSFFRIAAADLARDGLPDLAKPSSQQFYCDVVADADLVIVDNLSTLCGGIKENDADSWTPVQSWLLSLRRAGKSVLLIHHAGKSGNQRGTTRKEDVLDAVIGLRRPPDYLAEQGARVEVGRSPMCGQVTSPALGLGAGGRSPGYLMPPRLAPVQRIDHQQSSGGLHRLAELHRHRRDPEPHQVSGPGALACAFSVNQCNVANALNTFFNNGGTLPGAS